MNHSQDERMIKVGKHESGKVICIFYLSVVLSILSKGSHVLF